MRSLLHALQVRSVAVRSGASVALLATGTNTGIVVDVGARESRICVVAHGCELDHLGAVLPLGAIEAHGPHLPLGVDAMHNADLLGRALRRLPDAVTVLALPPLDFGVSCEHSGFAGTLELSSETAAAAWCDVGACVARAGVRKLVLYNSHGGNHALAEVVARRLRLDHGMLTVLAMNLAQGCMPGSPSAELFPDDEVRYGIHGGALETSLMLHLRPELVSIAAAKDFASRAAKQPKTAQLQLHAHKTQSWHIQDCSAISGRGIYEGMDWVTHTLRNKRS